ncbi:mammalian cell entry protein [Mycolicibacterium madagascariense]|uniref:Mammalian cell entry protein n=1 Tax=Mycolicibacterium madagascariense TaxID=212765 RepID=A0A7I7X7E8_9MYCO|nr:mammalian cell entry protein [Mycolicibacterium madagascariense]
MLTSSCAYDGVNSLPLPGTRGHGSGSSTYYVQVANVGTLEPNSPVLIDDVTVGSIERIAIVDRHPLITITVERGVVVPGNAVAAVGQTSLLGSMHVQLGPPPGQAPVGALQQGSTIPLNASKTYPSTERTLASLSVVANAGGLGQIGDIIHALDVALKDRPETARALIDELSTFVGTLNDQRDDIITTITNLDRFTTTLAGQSATITHALQTIPPALDVLLRERPRLVEALNRLRVFSDTATHVIDDTQSDLVTNLQNLAPTVQALADVGDDIDTALAFLPVFPIGQNVIDRGIRGDYMNLFVTLDLTRERLKRGLGVGTRFGDPNIPLVPAPGDEGYDAYYSKDPLGAGLAPPPAHPPDTTTTPPSTNPPDGAIPAPPPPTGGS